MIRVVGNLTTSSNAIVAKLLDAKIIDELNILLKSSNEKILKETLWAISNIAADSY